MNRNQKIQNTLSLVDKKKKIRKLVEAMPKPLTEYENFEEYKGDLCVTLMEFDSLKFRKKAFKLIKKHELI